MHSSENVSMYYEFEREFDVDQVLGWMSRNRQHAWSCSVLYVIIIFGIKWYMQNRKRYELRYALAMWSGILAMFSIFGAYRFLPNLYNAVRTEGFVYSFCDRAFIKEVPTSLWCALFTLSKAYELGDTLFIVLRKQPLIFLHWYHHITVLLYVWLQYNSEPAVGRWFVTMNYFVHAIMYSYYTLRALKISVPKWVNMFITTLQLSQMVVGLIINVWAYNLMEAGEPCENVYPNVQWAILMYLSYFVLFAHFFYNAYLKPKSTPQKTKVEKSTLQNGSSHAHGDISSSSVRHRTKVAVNGYN